MHLRNASTPVLNNSWYRTHVKDSLDSEFAYCQQQQKRPGTKIPFLSLTASLSPVTRRMKRAASVSDLVQLSWCKTGSFREIQSVFSMEKKRGTEIGGGRVCGGGSCSGDSQGFGGTSRSVDEYYLKLIEANPGNALVLSRYARFLKEIRGDSVKAEEYCERAILANPNDGTALSLYADLLWKNQRDAEQAEIYFIQAVNTAPDDCNVMASYARFLWDVEEERIEYGEAMNMAETSNPVLFKEEC